MPCVDVPDGHGRPMISELSHGLSGAACGPYSFDGQELVMRDFLPILGLLGFVHAHPVHRQATSDNVVESQSTDRILYLQCDQLTDDARGNRVIAQGNVEIYYNNYILT